VLRSAKMFKTATDYAVAFEGFLPIYNLGTMRKSLHFRKSSHFNPQDRFACSVLAAQRVLARLKTTLFRK